MSLGLPCIAAFKSSHPSVLLLFFRGGPVISSDLLGNRDVTLHQAGDPKCCCHWAVTHVAPHQGLLLHLKVQLLASSCTTRTGLSYLLLPPTATASPSEGGGDPQEGHAALLKPAPVARQSSLKRIRSLQPAASRCLLAVLWLTHRAPSSACSAAHLCATFALAATPLRFPPSA